MIADDVRRERLIALLSEARSWVARADNSYLYSSWIDAEHALSEVDAILATLQRGGNTPDASISSILLPTGPMQDLAIDSGWGDEFVDLAGRIDEALALPQPGRAEEAGRFHCSICFRVAGEFLLSGPASAKEVRRISFTSALAQPISPDLLALLRTALRQRGAGAVYALDPEFAPFYCPECDASFCDQHWHTWNVFDDDGFHDSIRSRCPHGHERMLED